VLRVVDPSSGRHAFLGLGFDQRGDAFDFTAALADHELHLQREKAAHAAEGDAPDGGGGGGAAALAGQRAVESEVGALHRHQDLSLKEGQTIHVGLKVSSRPGSASSGGGGVGGGSSGGGGGFMARAAAMPLGPLAPPPVGSMAQVGLIWVLLRALAAACALPHGFEPRLPLVPSHANPQTPTGALATLGKWWRRVRGFGCVERAQQQWWWCRGCSTQRTAPQRQPFCG